MAKASETRSERDKATRTKEKPEAGASRSRAPFKRAEGIMVLKSDGLDAVTAVRRIRNGEG